MQSFIVDQVLILKQSLKDSTEEKSPSDISTDVPVFCNWKAALDEIFKTVTKGLLKQGNNTETSRINCSDRFEFLSTTDNDNDDDDNSKSRKSDNTITEEFLMGGIGQKYEKAIL